MAFIPAARLERCGERGHLNRRGEDRVGLCGARFDRLRLETCEDPVPERALFEGLTFSKLFFYQPLIRRITSAILRAASGTIP
jgi:hypothetical protein